MKVDVDANPQLSQALRVQSIPAVFVAKDRRLMQGFIGAQPEAAVRQFVESLLPTAEEDAMTRLLEAGDEALAAQGAGDRARPRGRGGRPGGAAVPLGRRWRGRRGAGPAGADPGVGGDPSGGRAARMGAEGLAEFDDGLDARLDALLDRVKDDEDIRQEYVDVLELLGPADSRTAEYRKKLTSRLFDRSWGGPA